MEDGSTGQEAAARPPQAAAEAPAPMPRRHRRRRGTGLAGRLVLLTLALLVAVGVYGLSGRPIALPIWAVAEVEARLNRALEPAMPGVSLSIGGLDVVVDADWVPRLALEDLRLLKADGSALVSLPDLRMELDPGALLRARLGVRALTLSGARLAIRRDRQGNYDFAFGGEAAMPRIESFAQLFDMADALLAQPAAASLTRIEAEALTLSLTDERSGRTWEVGDGRLTVENRPDALAADLSLTLLGGVPGQAGRVGVLAISQKATDSARITATVDGVAAQDLAVQAPLLAPLGILDAAISGRFSAELGTEGVRGLEAALQIGQGALRPTPAAAPIAFDRATLAMNYDAASGRVILSDLAVQSPSLRLTAEGQTYLMAADGQRMAGPLGGTLPESFLTQIRFREVTIDPEGLFQEPVRFSDGALDLRLRLNPFSVEIGQLSLAEAAQRLTATGRVGADAKGWSAAVDLRLNQIAHDRLVALWPVTLLPRTRDWVAKNILKGKLFDVEAALRINPGQEPRLHLGYSFEQTEVRFIPTLPPIHDGYGYSTIDGLVYTVVLSRGRVTPPEGGQIDVSGSVMRVPDITQKPARGEITLTTQSSLTAALSLLDQPPFTFMTKADRPVDLGEGEARIKTRLSLPLQKKILLSDVDYDVAGTVSAFRSDKLVTGRIVTAPLLTVAANPEGLTISGPGLLGNVPFDATYSQSFAPDQKGKARIEGQVALSQAVAEEFGLGLPSGMVSGQGQAQVGIDLVKGQPGRLRLVSDLNRVGLSLPDLGWSKPAASTGRLEAQVLLATPPRVESLSLAAAGLKAQGTVSLRQGGGLDLARFETVTLNDWLQGAVEIRGRGAGRPVELAMTSGRVDMRRMPPASARKGSGVGGGPLSLTLDRLTVADTVALTGFRGTFQMARGMKGDFTARVNGGAAVRGSVAPAPRGTAVRLTSDEAGAVLRDAGVFASAVGGKLSVLLVPRDDKGSYDGQARIQSVRVRGTNVLAEMLNAISVVGLLEQLSGEGIVFNEVDGEFLLTPGAVQISRGSAIGASLGVSMAGVYQTGSGKLAMEGVISPIYMLNGIGALLTKRGEGVFGFNFSLRGTSNDPEVDVNPLSILTPGMFREIFRRPPPVLGEPKP